MLGIVAGTQAGPRGQLAEGRLGRVEESQRGAGIGLPDVIRSVLQVAQRALVLDDPVWFHP